MLISHKRALRIARAHLATSNPTRWNGQGNKAPGFKTGTRMYHVNNDIGLNIAFKLDPNTGWIADYYLVDKNFHKAIKHGRYACINDEETMSRNIMDMCNQESD